MRQSTQAGLLTRFTFCGLPIRCAACGRWQNSGNTGCKKLIHEAYSIGKCPGISPGSLLILLRATETYAGANVMAIIG